MKPDPQMTTETTMDLIAKKTPIYDYVNRERRPPYDYVETLGQAHSYMLRDTSSESVWHHGWRHRLLYSLIEMAYPGICLLSESSWGPRVFFHDKHTPCPEIAQTVVGMYLMVFDPGTQDGESHVE